MLSLTVSSDEAVLKRGSVPERLRLIPEGEIAFLRD